MIRRTAVNAPLHGRRRRSKITAMTGILCAGDNYEWSEILYASDVALLNTRPIMAALATINNHRAGFIIISK